MGIKEDKKNINIIIRKSLDLKFFFLSIELKISFLELDLEKILLMSSLNMFVLNFVYMELELNLEKAELIQILMIFSQ